MGNKLYNQAISWISHYTKR